MQTLSFSLSEIKKPILNNFRPVSGVSVFLNFKKKKRKNVYDTSLSRFIPSAFTQNNLELYVL